MRSNRRFFIITQAFHKLGTRRIQETLELGDQRLNLNGFKVVDEDKLRALKPEVIQELFQSGALGFIHAHLLSLNNVNKLGARMSRKLAN